MRNEGWGNGWGERRFEGSRMGGMRREGREDWDDRERSGRERYGASSDERGMGMGPGMGWGGPLQSEPRGARGYEERGRREPRGDDDLSVSRGEAPIVKVIEVVAQSPHSWEDAARRAVHEASRTIRDIKSVWVKDMQAIVTRDRIVEFRLVAKISFAIHDEQRRDRDRDRDAYA